MLLFAERSVDGGLSAFAGQAAAVPGSEAEREGTAAKVEHTEVFPLTLFAVGGMMLFASANDLLVMFVALEVFSLPLYLLCGLARRRRLISQEAAMKYFLLGAFASAFLLYGIALIYGYAGTMSLGGIADALATKTGGDAILLAGTGLIGVGLLFKVGAVPFHSWTPDVYQGAPTPVTGFMAACTKIAAFIGLMRVFYVALGGTRWDWAPMMWVVAILTMVVGSIVAITQTDVKRMLAYSSIAHAGFLLTAFVGLAQTGSGVTNGITSTQAVLFYLVCYGFPTIGAFALVTLVRDAGGEATHLSPLGRTGQEVAAAGGDLRLLPARLRRHPADRRLHRQVGRVHRRLDRWRLAAGRRRGALQPGRRVLLRPRDRADVLLRPAGRRAGRGPARLADHDRRRPGSRGHGGPRSRSRAGARPGGASG